MMRLLLWLALGQTTERWDEMQSLAGEVKVYATVRQWQGLRGEAKELALESLRGELGRMGLAYPMRAVTNTVTDEREGFLSNASFRVVTRQELLLLLFEESFAKDQVAGVEYLRQAIRESGGAASCEAVMAPYREKLKGPWVKALADVTAYDDRHKQYWDGATLVGECGSLGCLHVALAAVRESRGKRPVEESQRLVEAVIGRMRQIETQERDLQLELYSRVSHEERLSELGEWGLSEAYQDALRGLVGRTVTRARCEEIWRDAGEGLPAYLNTLGRVDEALVEAMRKAPQVMRRRVKYFWGGAEGAAMIEGLKTYTWAFRNGGESAIVDDGERKAKLVKFLDELEKYARDERWTSEESFLIRAHGAGLLAPVVAGDVGLLAVVLDKLDTLFAEARGVRVREAALLSEVLRCLELVREKRPQYRELIGQMTGKLRTAELAYVMRMVAEGPGKN